MKFHFAVKDLLLILYYIISTRENAPQSHPYQPPPPPLPPERRPAPMACLPPSHDPSPGNNESYTPNHMQLSLHRSIRIGINEDHSDLVLMFEPHSGEAPPAVCLTEKQCVHLIDCLQICLRDLSQMECMGND